MLDLFVTDETAQLRTVILGIADSNGPMPTPEEAYDPKSLEHIQQGTYPVEADMLQELQQFQKVLEKYDVNVLRPNVLADTNQIFTRDIGFVIDDLLIKANILPDRADEWSAMTDIVQNIRHNQIIVPPESVHVEGGDVLLWNDYIFVGTYLGADYSTYRTARTNSAAVDFLRELFPQKKVKAFDLIKSMSDPRANALHLDCCFQPVGNHKAIIYPGGFRNSADYKDLCNLFGADNLFPIEAEEMYAM